MINARFFSGPNSGLSGFLGQKFTYVATTRGRRQLYLWSAQMRRRWSGVFAALALAQFSLGGAVPRCPAPQMSSRGTSAQHAHAARTPVGERADGRVAHDVTNHGGAPTCDHAVPGACMGMTCGTVMAFVESSSLFPAGHPHHVRPRVLELSPGPSPAPEPPPPRI